MFSFNPIFSFLRLCPPRPPYIANSKRVGLPLFPFEGWHCSWLGCACVGRMGVHTDSTRHGPSCVSVWPEHLEAGLEGRGRLVSVSPEQMAAQTTVTPPQEAFLSSPSGAVPFHCLGPAVPSLPLMAPAFTALLAGLFTRVGPTAMCPDNTGSIFLEQAEVVL